MSHGPHTGQLAADLLPPQLADASKQTASRPDTQAEQISDPLLMQHIAKGDRSALGLLYDRYNRYVFAVCLRVLGNASDAEDVMIDVFLELWQHPHRFDTNRGSVATFLMVLARSRSLDLRRSQARRLKLVHGAAEQLAGPTEDLELPQDAAQLQERGRQIRLALAQLTDVQRESVELSFMQGLSHREIAEKLDTPIGTIKTRIRLGLIQLRKLLRNVGEDEAS